MRVFEFAKEVGVETIALMDKIREWNLPVKSHMASLDDDMMAEIKKRLSEPAPEPVAKKVVKKKAKKKAAKKTTKKKATTKKASSKKTVTKKTVKKVAIKRPTTTTKKVAATTEAVAEVEVKPVAKAVVKRKGVIRRKQGEAAPTGVKVASASDADAKKAAKAEEKATSATVVTTTTADGVKEAASTEAAAATPRPKTLLEQAKERGGRIVGKVDLSKIDSYKKQAGQAQSPRANRGMRPGFVAPAMPVPVANDPRKKDEPKKKRGAGKEIPITNFKAAEFRKREIIFQPKKKKVVSGPAKKTQLTTPKASKRILKITKDLTVSELANEMSLKSPALVKRLMKEGVMAKMSTSLDFDTISLIAPEFGFEAVNSAVSVDDLIAGAVFGNKENEATIRPPVITVMGHVDHGKTSLLDAIRKADVVSGEAGGITQHIGAYSIKLEDGKTATFIDTPGHAAFTQMRARGANVTDIAIIVVAADDGMMPQTEEAISHAQAAGVPIIVAVNKMDKQGANPEKIKQQLADKSLLPEDWGGDTIYCPVSAINKTGITELLEQIHLVAEVQELKSNTKISASGIVIESKIEKGKGTVATVLIKDGTLKKSDVFSAGSVTGKIRRMSDARGQILKEVGPGLAVEIIGLDGTPEAGDTFNVCETEEQAKEISAFRYAEKNKNEEVPNSGMSLDDIFSKVKQGNLKELPIVLKTDVAGTAEAIKGVLSKLGNDEVKVKVIHDAVGGVSENDVLLAQTAGGIVIGFNVRPDVLAQRAAKEKNVEIKTYSVIYNLSDDIKKALSGLLDPDVVEESLGSAEVREIFSVPKLGVIAGCSVTDGKITRNSMLRLVRDGRMIYEGKIVSLKRFKDDAKEVQSGYECGIGIENYNDIKVGDVIEAFQTKEVARELE